MLTKMGHYATPPTAVWIHANLCCVQQCVTEVMSVVVDVGLLSGKTVSVEAGLDDSVPTLKRRAETALGVGKGRLLNSGGLLDDELTVQAARLETGTSLTLQLWRFQIRSSGFALAAILTDSAVVAWGAQDYAGDRRAVQDQLKGVQQIQASRWITCGISCYLGPQGRWWRQSCCTRSAERRAADPSLSAGFCSYPELRIGCYLGRRRIRWRPSCCARSAERRTTNPSLSYCFAAILTDGSVVTWGNEYLGAYSRTLSDQLKGVQQIQASLGAFAAVLTDGL